jgi:peptidoglycan hydrolase-like protein with peptidoglycan-binding domain
LFFVNRVVDAGIVFLLLTAGISGPSATPLDAAANLSREVPSDTHRYDVKELQRTLQDEGHYRGKVDGVFGLRTRASILAYQKAENLPVTGQLDIQTAGKLGLKPEAREATAYTTPLDKPSAGIEWARGSKRSSKTLQKPVKK